MPASSRGLRNQSRSLFFCLDFKPQTSNVSCSAFASRAHVARLLQGLAPKTSVLCCGEQPLAALIEPLHSIATGGGGSWDGHDADHVVVAVLLLLVVV